jgi:hypothetical protein
MAIRGHAGHGSALPLQPCRDEKADDKRRYSVMKRQGGDPMTRQKFASQADPELLARMRSRAAAEGRQLQAVIEDAFRHYLAASENEAPRRDVLMHLEASVSENRELYRRLAQ